VRFRAPASAEGREDAHAPAPDRGLVDPEPFGQPSARGGAHGRDHVAQHLAERLRAAQPAQRRTRRRRAGPPAGATSQTPKPATIDAPAPESLGPAARAGADLRGAPIERGERLGPGPETGEPGLEFAEPPRRRTVKAGAETVEAGRVHGTPRVELGCSHYVPCTCPAFNTQCGHGHSFRVGRSESDQEVPVAGDPACHELDHGDLEEGFDGLGGARLTAGLWRRLAPRETA